MKKKFNEATPNSTFDWQLHKGYRTLPLDICHHLVLPYSVPFHKTLWKANKFEPLSAAEGQKDEATIPSFKWGSLPQFVRHPSKESKAEETHKKGKMIIIKKVAPYCWDSSYLLGTMPGQRARIFSSLNSVFHAWDLIAIKSGNVRWWCGLLMI